MDCAEVRGELLAARVPEGPDAARHLADCPACAELMADRGRLAFALAVLSSAAGPADRADRPDASEMERLLAAERAPLPWLRSWPTPARVATAAAVLVAIAIGTLLAMPRVDLEVYPILRLALELGSCGGLALGALALALRPLDRAPVARWVGNAVLAAAIALPWVLAVLPPAHDLNPVSRSGVGPALVPVAKACFFAGLAAGLPLLVLLFLLDRGGHRAGARALLAAAATGLAGLVALELHCPITMSPHLLLGHAPLVVALVCGYGGLRWAMLARTRSRPRSA